MSKESFNKLIHILGDEYVKKFPEIIPDMDNPSEEIMEIYINKYPNKIKNVNKPSKKLLLTAAKNGVIDLNEEDEDVQIEAVKKNSDLILNIKNPSEKVLLTAINNYGGYVVGKLKNLSTNVKIALIKKHPCLIKDKEYCDDEQLQLIAIQEDPWRLTDIKNPSDKIKIYALHQNYSLLKYIKNPTEEIELAAIKANHNALNLIDLKNKTYVFFKKAIIANDKIIRFSEVPFKLKAKAIKNNPLLAKEICSNYDKKSIILQSIAIKRKPDVICDLWHPTNNQIKMAVKQKPWLVLKTKYITNEAIILAIKSSGYDINLIRKISPNILKEISQEILDMLMIKDIIE